jgi:hypothetical protein
VGVEFSFSHARLIAASAHVLAVGSVGVCVELDMVDKFMQAQRIPSAANLVLCNIARDICVKQGRSTKATRACRKKISSFLRDVFSQFEHQDISSATAMAQAAREYANVDSVAFGFILQYPFSLCTVTGAKGAELRKFRPPCMRIGTRFFIQESKSKTTFEIHEHALGNINAHCPKPGFILGSVCLIGVRDITGEHVDEHLARDLCLSVQGLREALEKGYCWCWFWDKPIEFRRPILAPTMNISSMGCVLWTKTQQAPKKRLVPEAYLLVRTQEILAIQSQKE